MSHTSTIKNVPIRDIEALRAAVAELQAKGVKCELKENVAPRMYRTGQFEADIGKKTADYCLVLKDSPYDVAFVKQADGTYHTVFDSWSGHVHKQIGAVKGEHRHSGMEATAADIGGLMQLYSKHAATNAATAQGYYVIDSGVDQKTGEVWLEYGGM